LHASDIQLHEKGGYLSKHLKLDFKYVTSLVVPEDKKAEATSFLGQHAPELLDKIHEL
jgi:hypothetical protein